MSKDNFQSIADLLAETGKYYEWLDSGVRAIIIGNTRESLAFSPGEYIIGATLGNWKKDIGEVLRKLPAGQKPKIDEAILSCLTQVDADTHANAPLRNKSEQLALAYLSLAREIKSGLCTKAIPTLIQTKFPRSQAVYDSALLTWRVLADYDIKTDWTSVFRANNQNNLDVDIRYREQYSPLIAFGMCASQPSKAEYYLSEWPALQSYLKNLGEEPSETNNKKAREIIEAIDNANRALGINSNEKQHQPLWCGNARELSLSTTIK